MQIFIKIIKVCIWLHYFYGIIKTNTKTNVEKNKKTYNIVEKTKRLKKYQQKERKNTYKKGFK